MTGGWASRVDELYRSVVTDPASWTDDAFVGWLEEIAADGEGLDRGRARSLRRAVRVGRKLRDFWATDSRDPGSWESRVDLALGARAWRPTLDLAMADLLDGPDPERFADVQRRFRLVHNRPWLDGVDYDAWLQGVSG